MRPPKPGKVKQKSMATDEGGRGEYKKYTSDDMVQAVSVVVNGTHSFRAAVQCFHEKARAEMEKRQAAAAAKVDKAARQAERNKRAEAAARRVAVAAKAASKDKALLEKEDENLRQAAQKEARATDAITEQQEVLDGLQASMALAIEHTQNTTEREYTPTRIKPLGLAPVL
eukprot:jgi/Tetstr1/420979/TSEL_012039.t1